jgi:hypothetical protein
MTTKKCGLSKYPSVWLIVDWDMGISESGRAPNRIIFTQKSHCEGCLPLWETPMWCLVLLPCVSHHGNTHISWRLLPKLTSWLDTQKISLKLVRNTHKRLTHPLNPGLHPNIWRYPKLWDVTGAPPVMNDHDLVLKPMVTWGYSVSEGFRFYLSHVPAPTAQPVPHRATLMRRRGRVLASVAWAAPPGAARVPCAAYKGQRPLNQQYNMVQWG